MPSRLIRDGMLSSERVQKQPFEARWLYVTILLSADDVGLFELNLFKLSRDAAIDDGTLPALIQMLADRDLIRVYESGGKRYGFVPRFRQRLQIKRTKYPMPPLALMADDQDAVSKINDLTSNPPLDNRDSRKSTVVQPSEPEPEVEKSNTPPSPSVIAPHGAGAATPAQEAEGKDPKTPKTRGTRLPADWVLPKAWGVWALAEYPHWTPDIVRQIGLSFADHWHAATGRGSTKADWPATWRNWCRSDIQQRKFPKAGKQQTAFAAERTAQADRIMGSYAAEVRAADNPQPSFIDMEAFDAPRLTDG
jgi:hypothetical protein